MKIAVSACLLGHNCKYNGGNNRDDRVLAFVAGHEVIPICPETAGGLPRPRPAAEIVGDRVIDRSGQDVTAAFEQGAEATLRLLREQQPALVILKARSPSCGCREIYDGRFSGNRIPGQGITAARLITAGFRVIDEESL